MAATDPLAKHRRYLLEPPEAFIKEKLALFGVAPSALDKLPPVIVSGRKGVVTIHAKAGARPKVVDVSKHTRSVKPTSLDQLKEIAGVPNRAFRNPKTRAAFQARHVDPALVAKLPRSVSFAKLRPELSGTAVAVAQNLLYGPTDERMLAQSAYAAVSKGVLAAASGLTVFIAPDLVVAAGQVVQFAAYGALYFNNVIVYGSGTIRLGANTKLHAYQVRHV